MRYTLLDEIGRGASGPVHRAWDRRRRRYVAVKRLPAGTRAAGPGVEHPHVLAQIDRVDGGDVLVAGKQVFVGLSTRTNDHAAAQMVRLLQPHGYKVREVVVHDCLHLKSAVTTLSDDLLLVNPAWIQRGTFDGFALVEVDAEEPMAANALRLDDRILYSASFPRTAARLESRGLRVERVPASEVAKAEGAVTCCSLIVRSQ